MSGLVTIRRTGADDYGQYMRALICGPAGSGKTLIASTAPNPIYASAEGGLMSIADRGIPYVDIRQSAQLLSLKNEVDQEPAVRRSRLNVPIDTIVIDTIDEIQHILIQERLKETKQDSLQLKDWGWLGEQMQSIIRGFRNIPAHVIFLCHLKETSDGDSGRVWNKPGLQGAIADQIANFVDLSMLLRASTITVIEDGEARQKTVRVLQTTPDPMYPWIKDRSGKLPPEIDVNFQDDFIRIHKMIFGDIQPLADLLPKTATIEPAVVENIVVEPDSEPEQVVLPAPEPVLVGAPELKTRKDTVAIDTLHATPEEALPAVDLKCDDCGGQVESQDRADLSRIKYRSVLCKGCFDERKLVKK